MTEPRPSSVRICECDIADTTISYEAPLDAEGRCWPMPGDTYRCKRCGAVATRGALAIAHRGPSLLRWPAPRSVSP